MSEIESSKPIDTNESVSNTYDKYLESDIDKLYNDIIKTQKDGFDIADIVKIVQYCVKFMNKNKKLSGNEKKKVVIYSINKLIKEIDIPDNTKVVLLSTIELIVPNTIDIIVKIYKNKFSSKVKRLMRCRC